MPSVRRGTGLQGSRGWALAASFVSEGASGFLPLLIVPVLISRLGAETYALTLAPLALAGLLVSALDLGLALGMPSLWRRQERDAVRYYYVVAAMQVKLVTGLAAALVFYAVWGVAAPEAAAWSWAGAYLVMLGQLLFPNWMFIVTGRTIVGQVLNAGGRLLPIVVLFAVLRPGDPPGMVNALLGLGALGVSVMAYLILLPTVRAPQRHTCAALRSAWRLAGPITRRHGRLWMAQLTQATYRTLLPVIAAAFLAPTVFLAFSVSEKCLRACQSVQAYVLQFDFSRLIREDVQRSMGRRLLDKVVTDVVAISVGLALAFFFGFQWMAPVVFAGSEPVIRIALDLNPLLATLVVVGGLNYWLGTLGLPVLDRGIGLLAASAVAGIAALVSAALASQHGSATAFLLAMGCGEIVFLAVVLRFYLGEAKNAH